jgi:hypothetical protein
MKSAALVLIWFALGCGSDSGSPGAGGGISRRLEGCNGQSTWGTVQLLSVGVVTEGRSDVALLFTPGDGRSAPTQVKTNLSTACIADEGLTVGGHSVPGQLFTRTSGHCAPYRVTLVAKSCQN